MKYVTVEQLIAAYKSGEVTALLAVDNDNVDAYIDYTKESEHVFSKSPGAMLRALLDHVGIPWEEC